MEAGSAAARAAQRGGSGHLRATSSSSQAGSWPTDAARERVDAYSPARNRWRRLPALPAAVNHAMAASDGQRLYVVGGYGAPDARVPSSRSALAAAARPPGAESGGRGRDRRPHPLRVGGVAEEASRGKSLAFDRVRRRWSRIPGPKPREHLGVSALAAASTPPRARVGDELRRLPGLRPDAAALGLARPCARDARRHRLGLGWPGDHLGRERVARGHLGRGLPRTTCAPDAGAGCPTCRPLRHGLGVLGFGGRVYVVGGGPTPGLSVSGANEYLGLR